MFYRQWGVVVEIERHPEAARRLHAASRPSVTRTLPSGIMPSARPGRSYEPRTARSPAADWHWEPFRDDLLDGLPETARAETDRLANEIAVRESMVFLEGAAYTGRGLGCGPRAAGCSCSPT